MEAAMRKLLMLCTVVGAGLLILAGDASAQNFYFGFGTGPGYGYGPRPYYGSGYGPRPYYYAPRSYNPGYYRPYSAYGYGDCYWRTRRYFDDYRGVWVVRRFRVCN